MTTTYQQYLSNLDAFLANADRSTGVKFLYYSAQELDVPRVRSEFLLWKLGDRRDLYLCRGPSKNYVYMYEKSDLKALVRYEPTEVRGTGPQNSRNYSYLNEKQERVVVVKKDGHEEVNVGNHIDFSIHRQRSADRILIKTHLTTYEHWDEPYATRNADRICNFFFSADALTDLSAFIQTGCDQMLDDGSIVAPYQIKKMYAPLKTEAIYHLLRIVGGMDGGGAAVRRGARGGLYSIVNGCKRYLPHRPQRGGSSYKGVTFLSDAFATFISAHILRPVRRARPQLHSAQVIYDELNELNENGSQNLVFVYDFGDDKELRNVFFVDTVTALTACYADAHPATATPHEGRCLERIKAAVASAMVAVP